MSDIEYFFFKSVEFLITQYDDMVKPTTFQTIKSRIESIHGLMDIRECNPNKKYLTPHY